MSNFDLYEAEPTHEEAVAGYRILMQCFVDLERSKKPDSVLKAWDAPILVANRVKNAKEHLDHWGTVQFPLPKDAHGKKAA